MAQEPLQSLFVAGAFIAVRSEAASPERLSRSLAAALESVDPDVRVSFLTGTGVVDFALAGSPGGPPGDFRWSARLVAHGSRTGWRDGVPNHAIAPRTRGSRRAREHNAAGWSGWSSRVCCDAWPGGGVGLGFALWTSRMAESMLFGVEPRDPRSSSAAPPSRSRSSVCSPAGYRRIGHPGSTRRARCRT